MSSPDDITTILKCINAGEPGSQGRLLSLIYEELRQLARRKLAREGASQTLEPTALVHEAFLRLTGGESASWDS